MESAASFLTGLLDQVNHLKQLPRTGWLLAGVSNVESVAEHSFSTAVLSMFLADRVNAEWIAQGLVQPLDVPRVMRLALIHDLAECVLTDLPKRSSELLGADVKHDAETRALAEVLADAPDRDGYLQLLSEYHAGNSPEARLVRDADKLEMVHQARCYGRSGQTNLQEFWQGHRWHYPVCAALFAELEEGVR